MTLFKKFLAIGTVILSLSASSIAVFGATTYKTPIEELASILETTVEDIYKKGIETGKSLWTIAEDAGKLNEFKEANIEQRKEILKQQVSDGYMTQDQADLIIENIESNPYNYGGGYGHCGYGGGYGYGGGHGHGYGYGRAFQ